MDVLAVRDAGWKKGGGTCAVRQGVAYILEMKTYRYPAATFHEAIRRDTAPEEEVDEVQKKARDPIDPREAADGRQPG